MRVVIADDAPLIREGIATLLAENGVEVVQQVGDADALLASVRDRLDALDATLTIDSPAGGDTAVRAEFPCAS